MLPFGSHHRVGRRGTPAALSAPPSTTCSHSLPIMYPKRHLPVLEQRLQCHPEAGSS
ncbi:hypothetical protein T484DRAFT_1960915 [Baffinella frigidus]|nr:hypothetical protein T484DRAFT_1960915 [Cryptophyta sp. CCMP2293]